jgi:hypothetical protein
VTGCPSELDPAVEAAAGCAGGRRSLCPEVSVTLIQRECRPDHLPRWKTDLTYNGVDFIKPFRRKLIDKT